MEQEELARISASPPRRMIGVSALVGLGGLLIYMAMATPMSSAVWQLVLLLFGGGALWASQIMWNATAVQLVLTNEGLIEDTGKVLALFDEIEKVDRSPFALKPSNGFVIILKEPKPRAWRPGLWWRIGRRVAIGGVTSGGQTKPVADIMLLKMTDMSEFPDIG